MAQLLIISAAVLAIAVGSCRSLEFEETTIDDIQLGFKNGSLTSTNLVRFYLDRISRLNPLLNAVINAVIEVNPNALREAARADAEQSSGRCHSAGAGPRLHGIPVLLKDNIATSDRLSTTGGSLALLRSVARQDAGVVRRLRATGTVVLGKANLEEWANFRTATDTRGWSARGDQARVGALQQPQ